MTFLTKVIKALKEGCIIKTILKTKDQFRCHVYIYDVTIYLKSCRLSWISSYPDSLQVSEIIAKIRHLDISHLVYVRFLSQVFKCVSAVVQVDKSGGSKCVTTLFSTTQNTHLKKGMHKEFKHTLLFFLFKLLCNFIDNMVEFAFFKLTRTFFTWVSWIGTNL